MYCLLFNFKHILCTVNGAVDYTYDCDEELWCEVTLKVGVLNQLTALCLHILAFESEMYKQLCSLKYICI